MRTVLYQDNLKAMGCKDATQDAEIQALQTCCESNAEKIATLEQKLAELEEKADRPTEPVESLGGEEIGGVFELGHEIFIEDEE